MWPFKKRMRPSGPAIFNHHLSRALAEPGCPVCRLTRSSEERWIWTLLYEFTGDPKIHTLFSLSYGLCAHHAELMRRVVETRSLMTPSGVARLYETAVQRLIFRLTPRRRRVALKRDECPLCSYAKKAADRQAYFLARILESEEWERAFLGSDGLCLTHFQMVLAHASPQGQNLLINDFSQRLKQLKETLAALQKKQRYDVTTPILPEEAESWREALWRLGGMTYDHLLVGDSVGPAPPPSDKGGVNDDPQPQRPPTIPQQPGEKGI